MPLLEVVRKESHRGPVVAIDPVGDFQMTYDMIEGLVEVLIEEFDITIKEKLDGPSERVWKMEIEGHEFNIYDEFGSGLEVYARNKSGKNLLDRIGKFLEKRIPKD